MTGILGTSRAVATAAIGATLVASPVGSDPLAAHSYNLYGNPGLLDMPTAEVAPDAELSATYGNIGNQQRTTLTFQIAPRLSGSFRYSRIPDYDFDGTLDRYDRSFDLRFQLLEDEKWWPALSIGLRDFVGTGIYSSEYIVATKEVMKDVRLTYGLGWGRLASANQISDGYGERTGEFNREGGSGRFDQIFRGPISHFGGVSWKPTDKLTFKLEYSSDAYVEEAKRDLFDYESPWNYGLSYEVFTGATLTAASVGGNELAVQFNVTLNPKVRPLGPGNETAPLPVLPRPDRRSNPEAWSTAWTGDAAKIAAVRNGIAEVLTADGIAVEGLALRATTAEIRIDNSKFSAQSEAIGRTARAMARFVPASVETFVIVPVVDGVPSSAVTMRRSDVERLENDPGLEMLGRSTVTAPARPVTVDRVPVVPGVYPRLRWALTPYTQISLFDPDNPFRADLGAQLAANIVLGRGIVVSGAIRKRVIGNLDEITRVSDSVLPHVRSDFPKYLKQGDPRIENLYTSWFARPAPDVYSRVTVGLLEWMYGGVSGELLWKPADSRLAIGAELNYVQQRDYEGGFGFLDYKVLTGHVSGYYEMENGYGAQLDVGRYLAGDYGATISLSRSFDNGWTIGAFATFTDVPAEEFGEGSFDKGIWFTLPFDYLTAQPTRKSFTLLMRPLTRDGGQRVDAPGRLYSRVRDMHEPVLEARGGRFWK